MITVGTPEEREPMAECILVPQSQSNVPKHNFTYGQDRLACLRTASVPKTVKSSSGYTLRDSLQDGPKVG